MFVGRLSTLGILFFAGAAVALAGIIPPPGDPDIIIDAGGLSPAITVGSTFGGTGDGSADFFNDTPNTITALTFEILIKAGLDFSSDPNDPNSVRPLFTCANGGGFFLNCSFTYAPNGTLDIMFFGTVPDPTQVLLHPGIPPGGHFLVDFGGWSFAETPAVFDVNNPNPLFEVKSIQTTGDPTPEPSTALLFAPVLLAAGIFARRRLSRA